MATIVVFRKWPNGDIDAFFPDVKSDNNGKCMAYAHVGQHSGADYAGCIRRTKPAKPKEYADLRKELRAGGYDDLVIRSRYIRRRK